MAQLLMAHHQYDGHVSMRKLQTMAAQGVLPKRLAKCRIPVCSACLWYAKATRKLWRGKPRLANDESDERPIKPGQVVSVDHLVSPTPGLIAQMTGFLTTKRYKYATVYVDQFSPIGFVHLQKTASAEETVEGKQAFEAFAKRNGLQIENYHADNGIFKARLWTEACVKAGQGLTFAGVNAHHQNGVAERRIKKIQEMARTMLIHANSRWPDSVTTNLWPYAVRTANDAINNTPSMQDGERRTPTEIFSKSKVASNPKHWKAFGCPVYVLDNSLQGQLPFHKWKSRSKVGVYVGKSPMHGQNVALVLDRETGLVSLQFHVVFDPMFETVKHITVKSKWQIKAGFVGQWESSKPIKTGKTLTSAKATPGAARATSGLPTGRATNQRRGAKGRKRRSQGNNETSDGMEVTPESPSNEGEPAAASEDSAQNPPPLQPDQGTNGAKDQRPIIMRSGRKTRPIHRLIEAMMAEVKILTTADVEGEIMSYQAMFPDDQYEHDDPIICIQSSVGPRHIILP